MVDALQINFLSILRLLKRRCSFISKVFVCFNKLNKAEMGVSSNLEWKLSSFVS